MKSYTTCSGWYWRLPHFVDQLHPNIIFTLVWMDCGFHLGLNTLSWYLVPKHSSCFTHYLEVTSFPDIVLRILCIHSDPFQMQFPSLEPLLVSSTSVPKNYSPNWQKFSPFYFDIVSTTKRNRVGIFVSPGAVATPQWQVSPMNYSYLYPGKSIVVRYQGDVLWTIHVLVSIMCDCGSVPCFWRRA